MESIIGKRTRGPGKWFFLGRPCERVVNSSPNFFTVPAPYGLASPCDGLLDNVDAGNYARMITKTERPESLDEVIESTDNEMAVRG